MAALLSLAQPLDFVQALAPAKKALEISSAASAAERATWLNSVADRLRENENELAAMEADADGWPHEFTLEKSVRPMQRLFRRLAGELAAASDRPGAQPTGLIAIVAPGPFGFRVAAERLAPALAAGNAVFIKVSSRSPVSAAMWARVLGGLPTGLVTVLPGDAALGALMVSHPSIRAVTFAGTPAVAAKVARSALDGWKKMQISAGAKNSLLILPGTDWSRIGEILAPALLGAGRLGWAPSRIYVTESEAAAFEERAIAHLSSQTRTTSPAARENLRKSLELARRDQAKVLYEGEIALVKDLTHCSTLQLEELDHPLLILDTVKYGHEMVKWTNTADFGFAASVWGEDEKARRLGEKLQVGRVWINGWLEGDDAFAGWKRSFAGISDFDWRGGFFSDVKKLTAPGG